MGSRGVNKVYIGDLPDDASEQEIEKAFNYYGGLRSVWVARKPGGFAFVEFEDDRDAEDAVKGLDGTTLCGSRVRVELSSRRSRSDNYDRYGDGGGGGYYRGGGRGRGRGRGRRFSPSDVCYECGKTGHYAYDCEQRKRRSEGSAGYRRDSYRDRNRSRSRSYERRRYR